MFVDSSAFYAILDATDRDHQGASEFWRDTLRQGLELVTTNYVLTETIALLQRRRGLEPVRAFVSGIVPLVRVEWIDEVIHGASLTALFGRDRRQLSLVDCSSFVVMYQLGIRQAFAFD